MPVSTLQTKFSCISLLKAIPTTELSISFCVFKTQFQFNCVVKGLLSWNNSQPHPFRSPKYLHKYPQSYVQPMSSTCIHLKTIAMYVQLEAWIVEKIIFLYFRFMRRKHNL